MVGALWLAGRLLSIRPKQIIWVLANALFRGHAGRAATRALTVMEYVEDRHELAGLRGLALVLIGLLFQLVPYTFDALVEVWRVVLYLF